MTSNTQKSLAEMNFLQDAMNDPEEYYRLIGELRKTLKKDRGEEERETAAEATTVHAEIERQKRLKEENAKLNEIENRWGWGGLPHLVIAHFMDYLDFHDRRSASQVCKSWYWTFFTPSIWREISLKETSFVHSNVITIRSDSGMGSCIKKSVKTGLHKGWLNSVGEYVKSIRLYPMEDYNIMNEHCAILKNLVKICLTDLGYYPLPRLKHFAFTFNPPEVDSTAGAYFAGTGGNIMQDIVALSSSFLGLEDVAINDLLLETSTEVSDLILGLVDCCGTTLRRLQVLNLTRDPLSVAVFLFSRLHTLVVSPPQITPEMLVNFGSTPSLKKVHIVQDKFATPGPEIPGEAWQDVVKQNPVLRIRLHLKDDLKEELLFQPHAPVSEILYESKYAKVTSRTVCYVIDHYSKTLTTFAILRLPRYHSKKSFHDRADSSLVLLARNCPRLSTIVFNGRLSTSTLLLIASRSKQVNKLLVRKNAILKKAEWPKSVAWTDVWFAWFQYSSRCYERTLNDIRDLLRQPGWNWLSDFEFSILETSRFCDESCGLSPPNSITNVL